MKRQNMKYQFNFIVTIESDDEHEFDDMLAELENACICIGNSYQGTITLSEGERVEF
jgi:hypothetical protein